MRVGIGYDIHRFGADRPLVLGGVAFPDEPGLAGHSDADPVMHAVADAVLGAAALGDIGEHFPDTDPAWRGADSARLLAEAVRLAAQERGLELATQGITEQQRLVVADIIQNAMSQGLRPTDLVGEIKANIGLTNRDYIATLNRRELHLDAGYSAPEADALVAKYRETLLKKRANLIARTETIKAQSQGRRDAWKVAQESGDLPSVRRKWIARPGSPDPNAPCEICMDLDGKTATLDGTYESLEGPVDGPPAHPACVCSEVIERAK